MNYPGGSRGPYTWKREPEEELHPLFLALKVERVQEPRNMGGWKRQKNGFSSRESSRKDCSPASSLILAQGNPVQTF